MSIIVISVLVTLPENLGLSMLKEIIQVILHHCRRGREITLRKLVDIQIIVSTKKIIHLLVILRAVPLIIYTTSEREGL